jgi:hypothetical protein
MGLRYEVCRQAERRNCLKVISAFCAVSRPHRPAHQCSQRTTASRPAACTGGSWVSLADSSHSADDSRHRRLRGLSNLRRTTGSQRQLQGQLATTTIGSKAAACTDRPGMERTAVAATPNKTELTIPHRSSAMLNWVDLLTLSACDANGRSACAVAMPLVDCCWDVLE